jgi:hypothetical protein
LELLIANLFQGVLARSPAFLYRLQPCDELLLDVLHRASQWLDDRVYLRHHRGVQRENR